MSRVQLAINVTDVDAMSLTVLTDGEGGACCAPTSDLAASVTTPVAGPTCC